MDLLDLVLQKVLHAKIMPKSYRDAIIETIDIIDILSDLSCADSQSLKHFC